LDTVVNLKRPSDYEATEGARFEVHFEKSRGFSGDGAESFEAALVAGVWIVKSLSDEKEIQVLRLKAEGLKQREIAQEVGLSLSKVNRIIKKAEEGPGYGLKP
jgi:putative DNA primase/helicase